MKKQLRLKEEVKDFIGAALLQLAIVIVIVAGIIIYNDRMNKIENGELVLVNQNQMDR